jgi:hypothetical protein
MCKYFLMISVFFLTCCLAVNANASDEFKITGICINAGYDFADVSMKDINSNLNAMADQALQGGFTVNKKNASNAQGFYAEVSLKFSIPANLSVGLRAGELYSFASGFNSFRHQIYDRTWNNWFNSSMLPVLAGASYSINLPFLQSSISASIHLGAGFASISWGSFFSTNDPGFTPGDISSWNFLIPAAGTTFIAEIHTSACFNLWGPVYLNLDLGYRFADFPYLYITKNVNGTFAGDLKPGDTALAMDGSIITLDFSGMDLGAGINIKF